jgi:hypothetical protein
LCAVRSTCRHQQRLCAHHSLVLGCNSQRLCLFSHCNEEKTLHSKCTRACLQTHQGIQTLCGFSQHLDKCQQLFSTRGCSNQQQGDCIPPQLLLACKALLLLLEALLDSQAEVLQVLLLLLLLLLQVLPLLLLLLLEALLDSQAEVLQVLLLLLLLLLEILLDSQAELLQVLLHLLEVLLGG